MSVSAGLCEGDEEQQKAVSPVEAQGDLWLVCVEVVAADAGDGLHVCVVLLQDLFIVLSGRGHVIHFLEDTVRQINTKLTQRSEDEDTDTSCMRAIPVSSVTSAGK